MSIQDPVSINEYSEPEPDVVIAKFREDFYENAHPEPADVLLVIEVADTSLTYDRTAKIPLYAAAGIAESWLVDLTARHITVFSQPDGAAYLKAQTFQAADTLSVPGYPDVSLTVDELGL